MNILIAGDFCPIGRISKLIEDGNSAAVLGEIQEVVKGVDYSIVNLESPVISQKANPLEKYGPNLFCSKRAVESLKWAGFKCVTLANNHFLDFGIEGVKNTIEACKAEGIDYVGGGFNLSDAAKTLYVVINGEQIAIINCCEHEFSIATESSAGSNPLNLIQQFYAIQQAKKKAKYVFVIVHGGVEHFWLPSPRMKDTYRFFIDAGADAVINHHQHCYSGYEIYNKKPIFYGIGNFCFDGNKENELWTTGFVVSLNISEDQIDYELFPYRQCYQGNIGVHLLTPKDCKIFYEKIKHYNGIIADDFLNKQEYIQWCRDKDYFYKLVLNPLYNRYTKGLFDSSLCRKLFRRRWIYAKDMIENESHLERLKMAINNMIK